MSMVAVGRSRPSSSRSPLTKADRKSKCRNWTGTGTSGRSRRTPDVYKRQLFKDKAFVTRLQAALVEVGPLLKTQPQLLPAHYTGFVASDNSLYKPIRDAGLATGKLQPL